jgi:hypothetical protein
LQYQFSRIHWPHSVLLHCLTQISITTSLTAAITILVAFGLRFLLGQYSMSARLTSFRRLVIWSVVGIGSTTLSVFLLLGLSYPAFRNICIFMIQKFLSNTDSLKEASLLFSILGFALFIFFLFRSVRFITKVTLERISNQTILEVKENSE